MPTVQKHFAAGVATGHKSIAFKRNKLAMMHSVMNPGVLKVRDESQSSLPYMTRNRSIERSNKSLMDKSIEMDPTASRVTLGDGGFSDKIIKSGRNSKRRHKKAS